MGQHPLLAEVERHGNRAVVIPASRLSDSRKEITQWLDCADLPADAKREILANYNFELPRLNFEIKSIILVACPFPAYANVEFVWNEKRIQLQSIVSADLQGGERYLRRFARVHGFNLEAADALPVKRLAVCSGLAVFGKNNITYVEDMGSFLYYLIFFSDLEPVHLAWHPVRQAEPCAHCPICCNSCETRAIRPDRFLLDTPRCLCFINESPEPFPDWLPLSVHHLVYDCLKCQLPCPMNRKYVGNVDGPIKFDAEETSLVLAGGALSDLPPALYEKVNYLGFSQWWPAIPRNLKMMLELQERSRELGNI